MDNYNPLVKSASANRRWQICAVISMVCAAAFLIALIVVASGTSPTRKFIEAYIPFFT